MLKRFFLACVVMMPALFSLAAPKSAEDRPAAFPKVDLLPGSKPFYAAVMIDVQTNQVGYVMFDGNVSNGYERLYFWVPEDMNYRTPKMFRYNAESKRFGPIKFSPRHDKDEIKLDWSFSWVRQDPHTYFDYVSGQTRKSGTAAYPRFYFRCDYARQPRSGSRGDSLVDITIPGEFSPSVWTNLPAPLQPWNTLNYYMGVKLLREKDATQARFEGVLSYAHHHRCEVRAMPRDAICTLVVAPYMGKPVYSNDLAWADAMVKGVVVKLDYGWYDLNWNLQCPGLKVAPRLDVYVRASPYPITRFDD